jgi:sulfur carrier protein
VLIKINGTESEVSDGLSGQELISIRGLPDKAVMVELNGAIVRRELWKSTQIRPEDCLEIIRIIGGG